MENRKNVSKYFFVLLAGIILFLIGGGGYLLYFKNKNFKASSPKKINVSEAKEILGISEVKDYFAGRVVEKDFSSIVVAPFGDKEEFKKVRVKIKKADVRRVDKMIIKGDGRRQVVPIKFEEIQIGDNVAYNFDVSHEKQADNEKGTLVVASYEP